MVDDNQNLKDLTQKNLAPKFIYGTAWKGNETKNLVKMAINAGFKAIDTANQLKHYYEEGVGEALFDLMQEGLDRNQIFLQSKFTPVDGQDHRTPYDPKSSLTQQVEDSFQSSLKHLHTDYLDSYLLHGPYSPHTLVQSDWEVWLALENLYQTKKAKLIGISNVNIQQLKMLTDEAKIKPMVVQNRCYAVRGWDQEVRNFCQQNKIIYQGFSVLTANPQVLTNEVVQQIAKHHSKTPAQIIFKFCMHIGIVPLTGTHSEMHMEQDLEILHFDLGVNDLALLEETLLKRD